MSEKSKIYKAHALIAQGKTEEAEKILWTLYPSKDSLIRVDAVLALLSVLNHVTQNDKLLEITDVGIEVARQIGKQDVLGYLMAKKCTFLLTELSTMIHREKNLVLSANVFKWIEFSLERDKKEYFLIKGERKKIEKEVEHLVGQVLAITEQATDHYFRGHLYSSVGDYYSSKYLTDQLDFMKGGRARSRIANLYFVRRWNLDKFLYDRVNRKNLRESLKNCFLYFEKSIAEFKAGGKPAEEAHTIYNLAVKHKITYSFCKAKKLLSRAKVLAKAQNEERLLEKIALLEKEVEDKNKHMQNYVEEMGLDMP